MSFQNWEAFLEAKKKENGLPPQGKNAKPYFAPNVASAKDSKLRMVEMPKDAFGDKASPGMDNPKVNHPTGTKPTKGNLTTERFVNETAKLSNSDFINKLLTNVKDNSFDVAKHLAQIFPENALARQTFVRELKETKGGMRALMNELKSYGESVDEPISKRLGYEDDEDGDEDDNTIDHADDDFDGSGDDDAAGGSDDDDSGDMGPEEEQGPLKPHGKPMIPPMKKKMPPMRGMQ